MENKIIIWAALLLAVLGIILSVEDDKQYLQVKSIISEVGVFDYLSSDDLFLMGNLDVDGNVSLKRPYMMASSNITQTISSPNTAFIINFTNIEDNYQILLTNKQNFTFQQQGDYLIEVSAIFTVDTPNKKIELWVQKNGVNIERSNTIMTLPTASTEIPLAVPFIIDVLTTDNIRFMMASNDAGSQLLFIDNTSYSPETPSIIVTMSKISEITK